jgi:capsular exopolysaccharide synthesis family protein
MSRIDEALKRAALGRPADARANAVDSSVLDRYLPEEPQAVEASVPTVRSTPGPARVIVAPRRDSTPSVGRSRFESVANSKLLVTGQASSATVEEYRRLAATLHEVQVERGIKTLMVTSALPQDGKSLTVANLALTLSEAYHRRVLLIDADLRRPSIHRLFGCTNDSGLADVIRSRDARLPVVEISPRLSVLTAGHLDASPLAQLTSDRIRAVVNDAATHFDWVLLDTPPVGLLADAQLLARVAEAVVFVIGAGKTPYQLIRRSIEELGADRILGTVLNRVDERALTVHDYYGGYYGQSHL